MYKASSIFRISNFRNQGIAWLLLTIFLLSFLPSVSLAQQPTATIKALSGNVLVSGQVATGGTVLSVWDTIQTQAGASVVLELSDGSELHLGENTQITLTDLAQTVTGARVSRVKLLWGRIRAFLSPQHQIEGSAFDIETPNALVGVKFSEPDIEVSYSLEKAETVGIAHTVELMAKNLVTNETVLVPVGSSVIITAVGIKVIAGIIGIGGASSAGSTGTGTASTTASTGSTGMGTGTKVAIGVGAAAAAGGIVALVASADEGDSETAESTGDLSGEWILDATCFAQGCTDGLPCPGPSDRPWCCGAELCECCEVSNFAFHTINQSVNTLSGTQETGARPATLDGVINGNSVSFTTTGLMIPIANDTTTYTGTLSGNAINGTFSGSANLSTMDGGSVLVTWTGTFTVTIK